ncbi:ATPase, AAA family [Ostertagia ostertagi]
MKRPRKEREPGKTIRRIKPPIRKGMSVLNRRDTSQQAKLEQFMTHFNLGRSKLMEAVEIDEKYDDSYKDKKILVCELYKQGMDEFKKAEAINVMDVPVEKRKEVSECKEKMKNQKTNACPQIPTRQQLLRGVDPKFGERLLDEMLDRTEVRFSDVIGCESAKEALEEAVILPALNPGLFSGLRQPVKGILLFGPPGNGKTMLAKAVASEARQVFFNISAASLTSKRFPKRVLLDLPDEKARRNLLKATLDKHNMAAGLSDSDIRWIASQTHGYSNSDLVALCKEAAMVPVRSIDRKKLVTCDETKLRNLRCSDFDQALLVIRPSSNVRTLHALADFARRAGQGG